MIREDIIRMAREAGGDDWGIFRDFMPEIERFANLVASAEREACATVCDKETNPNADMYEPVSQYQSGCYITAEFLAAAIRARGQHDKLD
jgi:hypothetical protein